MASRRGSALSFDGNDYIKVLTAAPLQNFAAKTVLMWINEESAPCGVFGGVYDAGYEVSPYGDFFYQNPNDPDVRVALKNTLCFGVGYPIDVTLGVDTSIGYVWDGSNIYTVKNGALTLGGPFTGTLACSAIDLYIGHILSSNIFFKGVISEVRIYNRALNAAEIKRLYESELLLARH